MTKAIRLAFGGFLGSGRMGISQDDLSDFGVEFMSSVGNFEVPVIPPKRYRIGEIVQHTGLSRQTIHNYTAMGLIREIERTPGGHRLYDETVFPRLQRILSLKGANRMEEIRHLLEKTGSLGSL